MKQVIFKVTCQAAATTVIKLMITQPAAAEVAKLQPDPGCIQAILEAVQGAFQAERNRANFARAASRAATLFAAEEVPEHRVAPEQVREPPRQAEPERAYPRETYRQAPSSQPQNYAPGPAEEAPAAQQQCPVQHTLPGAKHGGQLRHQAVSEQPISEPERAGPAAALGFQRLLPGFAACFHGPRVKSQQKPVQHAEPRH